MQADEIDPQALEAVKRQERFPLPHNRLGLKLLRWVTRPLVWYQNRDVPSVGRTVDRTIPGPAGRLDVRLYCPQGAGPLPTIQLAGRWRRWQR